MFSAADMLKFANMTTKELKEVLKDNGVNYSKMNKKQLQEAVLSVWKPIEEKPVKEKPVEKKPKFERVTELLEKHLAGQERLMEKYKQLFQELGKYKADCEKYEGLYDKYRKLFTDLRYKHDCLENDYNKLKDTLKEKNLCAKVRELIPTKILVIANCFSLSSNEDVLKLIEGLSKEYLEVEEDMKNYRSLYWKYLNLSMTNIENSNDIFTKNKDKWRKAFKDMAMKYHPDHGGDHEMMVWVNEVRKELKGVL